MKSSSENELKTSRFPSTDWSAFEALKSANNGSSLQLLNRLATDYWAPILEFLRAQGVPDETARDIVQDFFQFALANGLLQKADRAKGRFRSFLLASVTNFVANLRRREHAQKRRPPGGLAHLDELDGEYFQPPTLVDRRDPAVAFHKAWVCTVVRHVLGTLEAEFSASGKTLHYRIFQARVVAPELEGEPAPSLETLAAASGLTCKDAANRLVTAKRAFRRLLVKEVRTYANSGSDVAAEERDILDSLRFGYD